MNLVKVIKKLFELGKKINNLPFFWYSVHHYIKKDVSLNNAQKIWKKNRQTYRKEEKEFIVPTYDGSNQSVHPDVLFYERKYWLVVTPYPYGMEEYENPCIYHGNSIDSLTSLDNNPIDRQKRHEIGFHLSDPCIFEHKGKFVCAYRENTKEGGKESSFIHYKVMNKDGKWSDPKLIIHSNKDTLLSPAFYVEKVNSVETVHMIHVNKNGNDSHLIHSELNENMHIIKSTRQECKGVLEGYYVWHIAVSYSNGRKMGMNEDKLFGLFLLRNRELKNDFKLYTATSTDRIRWRIGKEIKSPSEIKEIEFHPYKACFIPNSNCILYSYVDKNNRYRFTVLDC